LGNHTLSNSQSALATTSTDPPRLSYSSGSRRRSPSIRSVVHGPSSQRSTSGARADSRRDGSTDFVLDIHAAPLPPEVSPHSGSLILLPPITDRIIGKPPLKRNDIQKAPVPVMNLPRLLPLAVTSAIRPRTHPLIPITLKNS